MPNRPTIPEVFDLFAAYHRDEPVWGSLHIVLEDGNYEDHSVEFCRDWATERGDVDGYRLACILLRMSRTQRSRIADVVNHYYHTGKKPGWPARAAA